MMRQEQGHPCELCGERVWPQMVCTNTRQQTYFFCDEACLVTWVMCETVFVVKGRAVEHINDPPSVRGLRVVKPEQREP